MDVLIVDGYNVIGASEDLRKLKRHDFAEARNRLIEKMEEYRSYSGQHIVIVFDALYVKGMEHRKNRNNVEIIYTKEDETADECIERLVKSYKNVKNQVYVATSDYLEQRTIFSRGALRMSAYELLEEIKHSTVDISEYVERTNHERPISKIPLNQQQIEKFEKMRRGDV